MVVNTEFYDLLGVSAEATDEEIRRGYLRQARKWHPDKCGGSEVAEARFKTINDAYKVLSDPQMRHVYDTSGKEGTARAREQDGIDPVAQTKELCRALFGFGKFDTLFGDPTTFPMFVMAMKLMSQNANASGREIDTTEEIKTQLDRDALKAAEEKEKEIIDELVVFLKQKLSFVTKGRDHIAAFAEMCSSEAEFLSNSPGGDELVGVLGYVYMQEAKQHSTRLLGMEALAAKVAEKGHNLSQKVELLSHAVKLLSTSTKFQRELERQEMLKEKAETPAAIGSRTDGPAPATRVASAPPTGRTSTSRPSRDQGTSSPFGPVDDSDNFSEAQQKLMEKMLTEGLSAMWKLGKFLVEQRVRRVCEGMFAEAANAKEKSLFVDALYQMGEAYSSTSTKMKSQRVLSDAKDEAQEAYGLPKFR